MGDMGLRAGVASGVVTSTIFGLLVFDDLIGFAVDVCFCIIIVSCLFCSMNVPFEVRNSNKKNGKIVLSRLTRLLLKFFLASYRAKLLASKHR